MRRIFTLYENLPEEGGKNNTTGGKQEGAAEDSLILSCLRTHRVLERVLSFCTDMISHICAHLSDELFEVALRLVSDYVTQNAKSNSVRALAKLIACFAKIKPAETIHTLLPHAMSQIEEELKNGASNVRTTSSHAAVASDTTLHWSKFIALD